MARKELNELNIGDQLWNPKVPNTIINELEDLRIEFIEELLTLADTVYCVTTLDSSHTATFNNIVTGNCGLGFDFSDLRPACFECKRTGGGASGPISFMNLYSHAFKIVQQYNRSGANIGILSIEHPDVISFIHMKDDRTIMNNFNISVMLTKRFLDQLNNDPNSKWFATDKWNNKLIKPRLISYDKDMLVTDVSESDITVSELFDEIVDAAWSTGEPGLLFVENINNANLMYDYLGPIHAVNPCGEVTLYANECCNLGSMNLEEFCSINPSFDNNTLDDVIKYIHTEDLKESVSTAILFMNNVVDKLDIPDDDLRIFVLIMRRLGLGIMGLADMLIKLKVPYNSKLGRDVTEYVLKTINDQAHLTSNTLIPKYGSVTERLCNPMKWITIKSNSDIEFMQNLIKDLRNVDKLTTDEYLNNISNCACTCIAPTGSTSMIHNVSSGIEPYYALAFKRSLKGELQSEIVMNKHLEAYLKNNNLYNESVIDTIISSGIQNVSEIPNEVKNVFVTAQNMTPEDHVLMQSIAQKHIDNSISKTCNFPRFATKDYVKTIYTMANGLKCKGITVYRDGCRDNQVFVSTEKPKHSLSSDACSNGTCDL